MNYVINLDLCIIDMPSHKDVRGVHKNVSDLQSEEFSKECKGTSGQGVRLEKAKQDNMVVSPIRLYLTTTVLCAAVVILTAVILQSYFIVTQNLDDTQTELVENNECLDEFWSLL